MAFPTNLTNMTLIISCPVERDIELELDDHEIRLDNIEDGTPTIPKGPRIII